MGLLDKVIKTIQTHDMIQKGDSIVIGVSGGPDSVCLLDVLCTIKDEYDLTLTAVHINHMLRGKAADDDQEYTVELCRKKQVDCRCFFFDINRLSKEWKMTTEEAGRKARYDAFYEVAEEKGADKIAVAQNRNDQAETILMRLIRGTGTDGLAGIEYMREGRIIRPLLDVQRSEIEAYCQERGLEPCKDLTNEQQIYTRNKIRLSLIPYLKENFSENIIENLGRTAGIAQEDKEYIYTQVKETLKTVKDSGALYKKDFTGLHPALQKRVILKSFAEIGLVQDIGAIHLQNALRLIEEDKTSTGIDFPGGYRLQIGYETLEFLRPPISEQDTAPREHDEELRLEIGKEVYSGELGLTVRCTLCAKSDSEAYRRHNEKDAEKAYFDYDKIKGELTLRTRRAKDVIAPRGMKGSKKLKEYFIDEKIPLDIRDRIPLICLGSDVVWIVGQRTSERYRQDEDTKQVLTIEITRDEDKKKAHRGDMSEGSEAGKIFRFAVPLLIGNVFQQLYSAVDGIVVGRVVGDAALAGVGASFPVIFLLISLLMGIGMGATVLISQYFGARDYDTVMKITDSILIATVGISIVFTIVGLLIAEPFLRITHTPQDAMPYALTFLKYTFIGLIGMAGYNMTSAILRGLGDSKTPLYFLILATVINFILLILFVVFMDMGVAGAALATAAAQFCSFVFAMIWLNKTHPLIHIDWLHMKFDKGLLMAALKIGLPSGLQQMLVSISMIIIQAVINPFGTTVVAGVTAAGRIQQFVFMPILNMNMAVSSFTGQNIGAGRMDRVQRGFRAAFFMSLCIGVTLAAICMIWGKPLVGLFNKNLEIIKVGYEFLLINMPFMIPATLMFMSIGVIRGAGDAMTTLIISMITLWCVRIPIVLILPRYIGYYGVFFAAADWAVGAILAYAWYKSGRWKKKIAIDRIRE